MLGSFFFQGSGGLSLARQREKGFCFFFKERGAISWFREPEKSNRGVVQGAKKMKTSGGGLCIEKKNLWWAAAAGCKRDRFRFFSFFFCLSKLPPFVKMKKKPQALS